MASDPTHADTDGFQDLELPDMGPGSMFLKFGPGTILLQSGP